MPKDNKKIKSLKPDPNSRYKQGYFRPINEDKYASKGPIIYRSGLEKKFCEYCDNNPNILQWSSEPIGIEYIHPVSKTVRTYYPDYLIKIRTKSGDIQVIMVEVKASNMLQVPPKPSKFANNRKKIQWYKHYVSVEVNKAKCIYAAEFCRSRGFKYMFLTEDFFTH